MDVRVQTVLAAALISVSINAAAANNDWTGIGPTGGIVANIVYSQNGNAAFMVAAGGYYRSQDRGVSWQLIRSDFLNVPSDVAIDPSDPTRVYVATANAPCLYTSTDGGATIVPNATLPAALTQVQRMGVSHDGKTIYLSNFGRIFYSADRGQTWAERTALTMDSTAQVVALAVDPTDSKTMYASLAVGSTATEGIFATHDGAVTWLQLTSGTQSTSLPSDLAINPSNPAQIWSAQYDGVWESTDYGVHWSQVLATGMTSIAIDPSNPSILYAGTPYGQVYRSPNAGASWADVSGNVLAGDNLHLAINPSLGTQLLAFGSAGVSVSTTSGTTWSSQQAGFNGTRIGGFSADAGADRIYINVPSSGVFYTSAGATVSQPVNNAALLSLSRLPSQFVTSILAEPGQLYVSLFNGLTSSTDGGNNWTPEVDVTATPPPAGSEQLFFMTSPPGAPLNILAAAWASIFKSSDGGGTWLPVTNGVPTNSTAQNLLFARSNAAIAYASFYISTGPSFLGVYKSTDSGSSWSPVNANLGSSATTLLAVDPNNANVLYGSNETVIPGASPNLLKSVDGGLTWSVLAWNTNGIPNVLTIDPVHSNILYAASNVRVGRSVDGGASWETLRTSTSPPWLVQGLIADPNRPENLLVGTDVAGVQMITIAPDLALAVTAAPTSPMATGATATYTYTASNAGPFDATGVKVTVSLPSTAQSPSASASNGTCAVSGLSATCTFPIVRHAASASLTVTAVAPNAGTFQVSAAVVGDQPDSDSTNNAVNSSATVTPLSDMSVSAAGNADAHVGDAVSYTLVATNNGPNVAPAAQLTFQMASGLTPGTVSSTIGSCTSGTSGQVTCNLDDLAVGKAATVTVNATANAVGAQSSTASVRSGATDLVSANNLATATTSVSAAPAPASGGGGGGLSLYEAIALAALLVTGRLRSLRQISRRQL